MCRFSCLCTFMFAIAPASIQAAPAPKRTNAKPAVINAGTDQHVKWVLQRLVSCAHIAILRDKKVAELAIVRRHLHDPKDTKELISWLEKNFRVECMPKTKLIHVSFRDGTPGEQAAIINLVINDFLKNQVGSQRDSLQRALERMKSAIEGRRRAGKYTLEQATKAEEDFKKREEYIKTLPALVEPAKAR